MDARERWQALQTNLKIARASVEGGDRARALRAVEAALAIDPEFLAAQSLRDRIIAWRDVPVTPTIEPQQAASVPRAGRPLLVSTEGYARFEERAKRRRVDKRIEAARSAIDRRKLREAASALDEVIELDPNLPELASLTAAFDDLRRSTIQSRPSQGPWLAAAAVFGATILAASWIQESRILQSRPMAAATPLVSANAPAPIVLETKDAPDQPTGTSGDDTPEPAAPSISTEPFEPSTVAATHEPVPPAPPPPGPTPVSPPPPSRRPTMRWLKRCRPRGK